MLSRLNPIFQKVISDEQAGFVPNRTIHDNISIAMELTQDLNRKVLRGNVIMKIDMEKAYDRVNWNFLITTMKAMGFSQN